mmetsp:Transcript_15038/g.27077  ORF Transcript_15038/g.27077 Transcript_15038/m.27077 type:complete len:125 (-) Transcript_15038:193-567(-)
MKSKGYDKTPDVRLLVPISVENRVVSWIDSKASFGDPISHTKNTAQMQQYVDRYGPGMVIYWFGYVSDLETNDDVYITDRFPHTARIFHSTKSGSEGKEDIFSTNMPAFFACPGRRETRLEGQD